MEASDPSRVAMESSSSWGSTAMIRAKHEPASEKVNCIGNVRSPSQARSFPRLLDEGEIVGGPVIDCLGLHVDSDELPVPCCV